MLSLLAQLGPVRPIRTPAIAWSPLLPVLILLGGAIVLMVVGALVPRGRRSGWQATVTVLVATGSIVAVVPLWFRVRDDGPMSLMADAVRIDGLALFLSVVIAVSVILAALLADGYLKREDLPGPEPYVLLLLSAAGGLVMASANDLIVMFLGLEILSLAVYVLAGLHVRRQRSGEAAMKYFVLGGFSSAFFLYGIALVYGGTGTTNLTGIQRFLASNALTDDGLLLAGLALLLVGFGFKVALAPFHSWTPDVYEGSPSPVVAYMASGVKVAGFAGLLRVFVYAFSAYRVDWQPIVYVLAVITLLVGSVLAVVQTNVKRMLAYSSINHAGFVLVAVQAASEKGVQSALFYLAAYTFMVAGSFGVATIVGRRGDNRHHLDDYKGLARTEPLLAFSFLVFLLAQAGVPLTSGFLAKFYVIGAAVEARSFWLALVAMLSSVISAFLYLRIVLAMYSGADEGDEGDEVAAVPRLRIPRAARAALVVSVVVTIGLGILPGPLTRASHTAVPKIAAGR
ncbi:MAG: proton-translocating NADH-quinone oxidoreductase, chain [Acidimicrobiales bacterium]|nr:proton-translocating NADH-quinone oxidoreductase, chain [Acidimicrobiales bacterium]